MNAHGVASVPTHACIAVMPAPLVTVVVSSMRIPDALNKLAASVPSIPSFVTDNVGLVGGAVTAGALYVAQKRRNPSRAAGHAVGALFGALVVWATPKVMAIPGLSGLVRFPGLGSPYYANPRMAGFHGPIFANPNTNLNLGRLARMQGVGDDNEDGLTPAP